MDDDIIPIVTIRGPGKDPHEIWQNGGADALEASLRAAEAEAARLRAAQPDPPPAADNITPLLGRKRAGKAPPRPSPAVAGAHDPEHFHAYLPDGKALYAPTGDLWPLRSVEAIIGATAANEIPTARPLHQMTWAPGEPQIIENRLFREGSFVASDGARVWNRYRPPTITPGDAAQAGPWLLHVRRLYGDDSEHLLDWLAARVQQPGRKINHAVILGGAQGIGKDSLLAPVVDAVGPWNCTEIAPTALLGRFTGHVESVLLRVSEVRDIGGATGSASAFTLYECMKTLCCAPPAALRVDRKHVSEYQVPNVLGLVLTTNYRDALPLPPDDRRFFVLWSELTAADFDAGYFAILWNWLQHGGSAHVAAWLRSRNLAGFSWTAPPPRTDAWRVMVASSRSGDDDDIATILAKMGNPEAVTLRRLADAARYTDEALCAWLEERKNRRVIGHRLNAAGYVPVSGTAKDGLHVVDGKRQTVYARADLTIAARTAAAAWLAK